MLKLIIPQKLVSDFFTNYKICSIECDEAHEEESDTNMEDLPVQGPLPQDPDDAPFRKTESGGIRKLYAMIFGTGQYQLHVK